MGESARFHGSWRWIRLGHHASWNPCHSCPDHARWTHAQSSCCCKSTTLLRPHILGGGWLCFPSCSQTRRRREERDSSRISALPLIGSRAPPKFPFSICPCLSWRCCAVDHEGEASSAFACRSRAPSALPRSVMRHKAANLCSCGRSDPGAFSIVGCLLSVRARLVQRLRGSSRSVEKGSQFSYQYLVNVCVTSMYFCLHCRAFSTRSS
jgi:hypothetical protein